MSDKNEQGFEKRESDTAQTITDEEMVLINKLARRKLSKEEVYTFPVVLCDNETDRDCERFSIKALEELASMFVGKTGIFDHDPKGKNQTARIYDAKVVRDPERTTRSGEVYTCILAHAYLMRSDANEGIIIDIDGGIKKEVSVCCSVKRRICSICGEDSSSGGCMHVKGKYYGGTLCERILDSPEDAYEWSFVAIPAQPNAGITKALSARESDSLSKSLDECRAQVSAAAKDITDEIVRLGKFCVPAFEADTVRELCKEMDIAALISFKERVRALAKPEGTKSVFADKAKTKDEKNGFFRIKQN